MVPSSMWWANLNRTLLFAVDIQVGAAVDVSPHRRCGADTTSGASGRARTMGWSIDVPGTVTQPTPQTKRISHYVTPSQRNLQRNFARASARLPLPLPLSCFFHLPHAPLTFAQANLLPYPAKQKPSSVPPSAAGALRKGVRHGK